MVFTKNACKKCMYVYSCFSNISGELNFFSANFFFILREKQHHAYCRHPNSQWSLVSNWGQRPGSRCFPSNLGLSESELEKHDTNIFKRGENGCGGWLPCSCSASKRPLSSQIWMWYSNSGLGTMCLALNGHCLKSRELKF